MKKSLFLVAITALMFVQCKKESNDPFLIKDGSVGNLMESNKIKQLDSIFATDSIVKTNSSPNAIETQGEVEVYEKGGKQLLLLSPKDEMDPNSNISDILIYDSRYKTEKGLSNNSTFKEFKDNYTVSNIERIINGVIVFFSDTDIYLTIDAKYLTAEVRTDPNAKLEAHHIIDSATIEYLRVGWNPED